MSINDPITVVYYERRNTYILKQGRETFYNESRNMREWNTAEEARQWAINNLGVDPNAPRS